MGDSGGMASNDPIDVFKLYEMRGPDECWPYIGNAWGGQPREKRPYFQANGRRQIAYRWIYELVHGVELKPSQLILHSCDNGGYPIGCGCPAHMRVGDIVENAADMTSRGRVGLPPSVVRAIRSLLSQGITQQEIADRYGVARETISAIAVQRSHKHVKD